MGDDELYAAQQDTLDLMRLVGADGWPARPLYTQQVGDLVSAFGVSRGFDEHDLNLIKPVLKALMHEEVASYGTSWRRIFPPVKKPALDDDLINQGPGYATDLDEATEEFLRFREHTAVVRHMFDVSAVNRTASAMASSTQHDHD